MDDSNPISRYFFYSALFIIKDDVAVSRQKSVFRYSKITRKIHWFFCLPCLYFSLIPMPFRSILEPIQILLGPFILQRHLI